MVGPVHWCVWADWADWTCWTYRTRGCSQQHLHLIYSAAETHVSARMCEPEMQAWPGIHTLRWTPPPKKNLLFLSPSSTLHPLLPNLPCPPPLSPTLNWLQKMASVSHLGMEIKGKLQRRLCKMQRGNPPAMFSLLILLSPLPSPCSQAVLFSSFPCFVFIEVQYNAVWNSKRKKSSPNLLQMKQKRQNWGGVPGYACLHLQSILWCK